MNMSQTSMAEVSKPPGIEPQVEDQPFQSARLQVLQGLFQIGLAVSRLKVVMRM